MTSAELVRWSRGSVSDKFGARAAIALACAGSACNTQAASGFEATTIAVAKWQRRFAEDRLVGLADRPRAGRRPSGAERGGARLANPVGAALEDRVGVRLWGCEQQGRG